MTIRELARTLPISGEVLIEYTTRDGRHYELLTYDYDEPTAIFWGTTEIKEHASGMYISEWKTFLDGDYVARFIYDPYGQEP